VKEIAMARMVVRTKEIRNVYKLFVGKPSKRDHFGDLDVDKGYYKNGLKEILIMENSCEDCRFQNNKIFLSK
jgi:hypothetical protein